jgi:hypothetical protein
MGKNSFCCRLGLQEDNDIGLGCCGPRRGNQAEATLGQVGHGSKTGSLERAA